MNMLRLLARRRSIRSYKERSIPEEYVEKLLQAALYSASSRGIRPWEIIIVNDRDLLISLSRSKAHGSAFLAGAPLAFVILGIPEKSDVWIEDTSILSENLLLEAESLELGACWIQIRNRFASDGRSSEAVIRELLRFPDDRSVESIISVGFPTEHLQGYSVEDLHREKVFTNRYES